MIPIVAAKRLRLLTRPPLTRHDFSDYNAVERHVQLGSIPKLPWIRTVFNVLRCNSHTAESRSGSGRVTFP